MIGFSQQQGEVQEEGALHWRCEGARSPVIGTYLHGMSEPAPSSPHRPSNTVVLVILVLAVVAAGMDLWDGYWPKTASSLLIVLGLVALLFARRYQSSRWRIAMQLAFLAAIAILVVRFVYWQGWV